MLYFMLECVIIVSCLLFISGFILLACVPEFRARRHHFHRQMRLLRQQVAAYAEQPSASHTYQQRMHDLSVLAANWLTSHPNTD
jgi:hypothetical protein